MSDEDSNLAALRHAREAFLKQIEQEKDPVKREKLKEFIPYMERTFSLHEIDWFRVKAIESANAARTYVDSEDSEKEFQVSNRVFWLRTLALLWTLFLVVSPIVIWTGMQNVYVYRTDQGSEIISESFEGDHIVIGENKIPMEFNRREWTLLKSPVARVTGVILAFFGLIALTLGKTELLK